MLSAINCTLLSLYHFFVLRNLLYNLNCWKIKLADIKTKLIWFFFWTDNQCVDQFSEQWNKTKQLAAFH